MKRFSKKTIIIIVLIIIAGLVFLASVTAMNRDDISGIESAGRDVLTPVKTAGNSLFEKLAALGNSVTSPKNLQEENEILKEQIALLQLELDALEEASAENTYLREMLGLAEEISEWEPVATNVIARSSSAWYQTVTIKGGKNKGFAKDMPVITVDGLVGRILSVSQYSSEVLLITDRESAVGSVLRVSKTPGVVEGDGASGKVYMIHIPADTYVAKDQVVVTSSLSGVFPGGLRIGYVVQVEPDSGQLTQKATIEPYVDIESLDNVFVLSKIPEYAVNNTDIDDSIIPYPNDEELPDDENGADEDGDPASGEEDNDGEGGQ